MFKFNALTGKLDLVNAEFTGDLGTNPLILTDSNGKDWEITIDTSGNLVITAQAGVTTGILLETGDYMLLETGDYILKE